MEEASVRLPLRVLADPNSGWSLSKWLVKVGDSVYINQRVAVLRAVATDAVDHALAPRAGTLVKYLVAEGDRVANPPPPTPIARIEFCPHSLVFKGLCSLCGDDVETVHFADVANTPESHRLQVAYTNFNLTMTRSEAQSASSAAASMLLKSRRLSLVLDLDHTLVHATDDPRAAAILKFSPSTADFASIKPFHLPSNPALRNAARPAAQVNMYVKLRPHLLQFLARMSTRFELSIYTMGTRQYADKIVQIIDPDKKLFGSRITSREDFSEGKLNQKNLARVFPVDDSMVLIVDDREDVWISGTGQCFMPNLLRARPYYFWSGFSEAYDRASSTTAPLEQKKVEAAPVKMGKLEEVKPNPGEVQQTKKTVRMQENGSQDVKSKVLRNSLPIDLSELLKAMPTSASGGRDEKSGIKSVPCVAPVDEKMEDIAGKPSYKLPKGTGVKSLPNPVSPACAEDSSDGDKETDTASPQTASEPLRDANEPTSAQKSNRTNELCAGNGQRSLLNGGSDPVVGKESDVKDFNGSGAKEVVPKNVAVAKQNAGPDRIVPLDSIPIPRRKPAAADAANKTPNSRTKLSVDDIPVPRKPATSSSAESVTDSKFIEKDNETTAPSSDSADQTKLSKKTDLNGASSEDISSSDVVMNEKENVNGSVNSVPQNDAAKRTGEEGYHGLNNELRATVHKWWEQEENSDFNGHLLRLAEVLERCHEKFFQIISSSPRSDAMYEQDGTRGANVKSVLSEMRKTVFAGCVFTFTGVFPLNTIPEESVMWNFATRYGARCSLQYESGVTTHVIASEARGANTEKTTKALLERTAFVVNTDWLEESMMSWERLPELAYCIHPPRRETTWEAYRGEIDSLRAHTYASVMREMQRRAPAVNIAERKKAELRKRDASGVAREEHAAKRARTREKAASVSEDGDASAEAGRVLSGDELNDALGELLDI